MAEAEKTIRADFPTITKMAVIAGAGVRPYYQMLGYELIDTYMMKELN